MSKKLKGDPRRAEDTVFAESHEKLSVDSENIWRTKPLILRAIPSAI